MIWPPLILISGSAPDNDQTIAYSVGPNSLDLMLPKFCIACPKPGKREERCDGRSEPTIKQQSL
jgi:hypothetical protein